MPSPIAPLNPPQPTMEHVIARMAYLYLPWRNNEDVCPRMYFLPLEWDVGECRLPDQTRPWIDEETNLGWRGLAIPKIRMKEKKGMGGQIQILRESENDPKKMLEWQSCVFWTRVCWSSKGLPNPRNTDVPHPFIFSPTFQNSPSKKDMVKAFSLGIPIVNVAFSS